MATNRFQILLALGLLGVPPALAQVDGRIEGKVLRQANGTGIGGVTVVLSELGRVDITGSDGGFAFDQVPAGSYNLALSLGENAATASVDVGAGETATVDATVDWEVSFAETITVFSASRRRERIVEAPAAVTVVSAEEIEREVSHGQIPKLLEFSPGVEVTQSGVYDFNLNTRGFNSSLNRRMVVLVDGRDPSVPFLASQEWLTVSQYMNDLASAELVRGPSSALYGANAFNGVLNLVTKQPRFHQGGELRLSGGELSTTKGDFRWAGEVSNNWFLKLTASYLESDDFSRDRTFQNGVEYAGFCTAPGQTNCLVPEVRPRPTTQNEAAFGNLRLDKHLSNGDFFSIEAGLAEGEQPVIQTGIGRFSIPDVSREWARFSYTADHWNFLGYANSRQGNNQTSLQSGAQTFLDSDNLHLEFQTNWDFAEGKVRLVAGASFEDEDIDTGNPQGVQTLTFAPVGAESEALFAQVDFDVSDSVKIVLAGRWDDSDLHDSQLSPKGSVVWSLNPSHTLRFTYNEAFQVANYSEFFLFAAAAAPVNLSPFEGFCAPFGVSCGFAPGPTPVIAGGNPNLDVEEVQSFEIGYTGIIRDKAYVTIDYYDSKLENFITDLLPNVGTSLGRLNPNFGPYQAPGGLPGPAAAQLLGALQAALGPTFFILSNNPFTGDPLLAAVSYTNFGEVDTEGLDLGVSIFINPQWRYNFNYSFFDFNISQDLPDDPLVANAPENQFSTGIAYVGERLDASINFRSVEAFDWAVGTLFRGRVPSYETVDLVANYRFDDHWQIGLNVSNLFDDNHFESFGGDLLERRALGHVAYSW